MPETLSGRTRLCMCPGPRRPMGGAGGHGAGQEHQHDVEKERYMNKPKAIGTAAESAVVKAARRLGFPHAERVVLHGNLDQGDVRLTPGLTAGVVVEVKGGNAARDASDLQILSWLDETETERINARADVAFLVTQRRGVGPARAELWWAHMHVGRLLVLRGAIRTVIPADDAVVRMTLAAALAQLRATGYGDPLEAEPVRSAA